MPDTDDDVSAPCWDAMEGPFAVAIQSALHRDDEHGKVVRTIG
jgi:hypothetical protein